VPVVAPNKRYPRILKDLEMDLRLLREKAHHEYHEILYRSELTQLKALDDIHLEVEENDRRYAPPVKLWMYVRLSADQNLLTRFGMDRAYDFKIQVPTIILEDAGLATRLIDKEFAVEGRLKPGDRFTWGNRDFIIIDTKPDPQAYWHFTAYPLHWELSVKLHRHEVCSFTAVDQVAVPDGIHEENFGNTIVAGPVKVPSIGSGEAFGGPTVLV
jgi:hypothetical protein